jgi:hypothetical protein
VYGVNPPQPPPLVCRVTSLLKVDLWCALAGAEVAWLVRYRIGQMPARVAGKCLPPAGKIIFWNTIRIEKAMLATYLYTYDYTPCPIAGPSAFT